MNEPINPARSTVRPSYATANLFMLFLLSYNILMVAAIGHLYREVWHGTFMGEFFSSPWFLMAYQVAGLLLPLSIFCAFSGEKFIKKASAIRLGVKLDPKNIFLIIALSILLQPFMMLVSAVGSLFLPNPVTDMIEGLAVLPIPAAIIIIAFTPAILEELVFRGFIQSHYEGQPIAVTAVVNGLFFGIIHMSLHQFTYAFAMGIVFAVMVYYTRSVFSAILGHFVVNASQYIMGYLAIHHLDSINPGGAYPLDSSPGHADFIEAIGALGVLSLLILPIVVGLFYAFVKHNRQMYPVEEKEQEPLRYPFDAAFFAVVAIYVVVMVGLLM